MSKMDGQNDFEKINKVENELDAKEELNSQRVFKKSSSNAKLTLYISSRDIKVSYNKADRLYGVLLLDPEYVGDKKVFGQITLTFRYGREDEEVMGLKFCNEAIISLCQIYPVHPSVFESRENTHLQNILVKRLGSNAFPFSMAITPLAPPSVQLLPAKEYNGAPIGTSYDVRVYIAERSDEKPNKQMSIRMGIRIIQEVFTPSSPYDFIVSNKKIKNCTKKHQEHFSKRQEQRKARSDSACNLYNTYEETPISSKQVKRHSDTSLKSPRLSLQLPFEEQKLSVSINDLSDIERNSFPFHNQNLPRLQSWENTSILQSNQKTINKKSCDVKKDHVTFDSLNRSRGQRILIRSTAPCATIEKSFLLSDGRIYLSASLDKAFYAHGENLNVKIYMKNRSNKTIKKMKVFVVQHVDVCMFSNGQFKNIVAKANTKNEGPILPNNEFEKNFSLLPTKSSTKNWIALEDSYTKNGCNLSPTVTSFSDNTDQRNVFAIYVTYYVKIKLITSAIGRQVFLKLPFTLTHSLNDSENISTIFYSLPTEPKKDEKNEFNVSIKSITLPGSFKLDTTST